MLRKLNGRNCILCIPSKYHQIEGRCYEKYKYIKKLKKGDKIK